MKRISHYLPVPTLRCVILLVFVGTLFLSLSESVDLIAGMISTGIITLVVTIYLFLLINIFINRRRTYILSGKPETYIGNIQLELNTNSFKILPLLATNFILIFDTKHVRPWETSVSSIGSQKQIIFESAISIPAIYQIQEVELIYGDILGLFKFNKTINKAFTFKAFCNSIPFTDEILSSYVTSGDTNYHEKSLLGDYYEFKPYHPSDGTKLIIWKTFARTGELVARAPEMSSNPSGSVLCFFACGRNPKLYKLAMGLLEQIEFLDLKADYVFEGEPTIFNSLPDFKENLVASTWKGLDSIQSSEESLSSLINQIDLEGLKSIVVFYNSYENKAYDSKINNVIQTLKNKNIAVLKYNE